jgi:2-phospho-L-lactate guanylyltransferase
MREHLTSQPSLRVWAAVPFKGPAGSKRRLASLLDDAERERLSLAMLSDVFEALLGAAPIERILAVVPHGVQLPGHADARLVVVDEHATCGPSGEPGGLNGALRQAQRAAAAGGADTLLIVPADLPILGPDDVEALLRAALGAPVVLAPDHAENGTNALVLSPPAALTPSFGESSFARHRRLAERAGVPFLVVDRPGLALDLDTPADAQSLLASGRDGGAVRLLRELGVERRLERLAPAQARSTTI